MYLDTLSLAEVSSHIWILSHIVIRYSAHNFPCHKLTSMMDALNRRTMYVCLYNSYRRHLGGLGLEAHFSPSTTNCVGRRYVIEYCYTDSVLGMEDRVGALVAALVFRMVREYGLP